MSIVTKIEQLKVKRSLSLITKKNAVSLRNEFQSEIDLNNTYLFEINKAISLWATHAFLCTGYDTEEPSIRDPNDDFWTNRQEIAASRYGDSSEVIGTYGGINDESIFPLDNNNLPALKINTDAIVLTTNRPTTTSNGVTNLIDSIISAANALYTARTEDLTPPPGADNPTFWNNTLKNAIENTIPTLVNLINNIRDIRLYVNGVLNNENTLISDLNLRNDRQFLGKLGNERLALTGVSDTVVSFRAYLNERKSFFETNFTTETERTSELLTFVSQLTSDKTFYENRENTALNIIGSDINDDAWAKYRYFWIEQNIGKPLGPQFALGSFKISIADSEEQETVSNSAFDIFNIPQTEWIETPTVLSVVESNEGTALSVIFLGSIFANKYRIYRDDITLNRTIDITQSSPLTWHVTPNEDETFIEFQFTDTTVQTNRLYVYRVQTFDTTEGDSSIFSRIGTLNSSSLKSPVIDDDAETIRVTRIENGEIILPIATELEGFYITENNKVVEIVSTDDNITYTIDVDSIRLFDTIIRPIRTVGRISDS